MKYFTAHTSLSALVALAFLSSNVSAAAEIPDGIVRDITKEVLETYATYFKDDETRKQEFQEILASVETPFLKHFNKLKVPAAEVLESFMTVTVLLPAKPVTHCSKDEAVDEACLDYLLHVLDSSADRAIIKRELGAAGGKAKGADKGGKGAEQGGPADPLAGLEIHEENAKLFVADMKTIWQVKQEVVDHAFAEAKNSWTTVAKELLAGTLISKANIADQFKAMPAIIDEHAKAFIKAVKRYRVLMSLGMTQGDIFEEIEGVKVLKEHYLFLNLLPKYEFFAAISDITREAATSARSPKAVTNERIAELQKKLKTLATQSADELRVLTTIEFDFDDASAASVFVKSFRELKILKLLKTGTVDTPVPFKGIPIHDDKILSVFAQHSSIAAWYKKAVEKAARNGISKLEVILRWEEKYRQILEECRTALQASDLEWLSEPGDLENQPEAVEKFTANAQIVSALNALKEFLKPVEEEPVEEESVEEGFEAQIEERFIGTESLFTICGDANLLDKYLPIFTAADLTYVLQHEASKNAICAKKDLVTNSAAVKKAFEVCGAAAAV